MFQLIYRWLDRLIHRSVLLVHLLMLVPIIRGLLILQDEVGHGIRFVFVLIIALRRSRSSFAFFFRAAKVIYHFQIQIFNFFIIAL